MHKQKLITCFNSVEWNAPSGSRSGGHILGLWGNHNIMVFFQLSTVRYRASTLESYIPPRLRTYLMEGLIRYVDIKGPPSLMHSGH